MQKSISTAIVQKMSSIEIARLTGKQHRHVMRDIRNMLMELEIDESIFGHTYKDISNRRQACFNLPERETMILVSGYNIKMRAAIIDRWQELEQSIRTIRILPPQLLRYTERKATVPIKHFIPFEIITLELTLKLAQDGHDMFREMMPESSFVRGWNQQLRAQGEHIEAFPTHSVYTSQGKQVQERTYPMRLWESANNHFWDTWMPEKAPKYLKQRQPQLLPIIPVVINDLQEKLNAFLLPAPQVRLF